MGSPALARVTALLDGWARDFDADDTLRVGDVVDDLRSAIAGPPADLAQLTPRQRDIVTAITDAMNTRGYPPSLRELGAAVGLTSTSTWCTTSRSWSSAASSPATPTGPAPSRSRSHPMPEPTTQHDHSGPDWRCEACKPLADVLRARMRWPSLHWGVLHDDAYPSLARAIHEAGYDLVARPSISMPGMIAIPKPRVPFGPKHLSEDEGTARYLDEVANNLSPRGSEPPFYRIAGSNVTATVITLLRDCAAVLRTASPEGKTDA